MRLLFLDLSLHLGAAFNERAHAELPMTELIELRPLAGGVKDGFCYGPTAWSGWLAINQLLDRAKPDLVVYEQIVRQPNIFTAKLMEGLSFMVEAACCCLHTACEEANNQTIKKWLTGSGRATKPDMVWYCQQLGIDVGDPGDHNRADAAAGWMYVRALHDDRFAATSTALLAKARARRSGGHHG